MIKLINNGSIVSSSTFSTLLTYGRHIGARKLKFLGKKIITKTLKAVSKNDPFDKSSIRNFLYFPFKYLKGNVKLSPLYMVLV